MPDKYTINTLLNIFKKWPSFIKYFKMTPKLEKEKKLPEKNSAEVEIPYGTFNTASGSHLFITLMALQFETR